LIPHDIDIPEQQNNASNQADNLKDASLLEDSQSDIMTEKLNKPENHRSLSVIPPPIDDKKVRLK
jgi:hypothetical protein